MKIPHLIIALVVGFIIGSLMTCDRKPQDKIVEKTTIKYIPITRVDTFNIVKPVVKYKHKVDTISIEVDKEKYAYTYNDTLRSKDGKTTTDISVKGWGGIDKIDYNFTTKDSIKEITKETTITKTIIERPNTLYLSGEYITTPDSKLRVHLDYTIKNKFIIGTSVGYDRIINKPEVGVKIGIKL